MTKLTISTADPKGLKLQTLRVLAPADLLERCVHKVGVPSPDAGSTPRNKIKIMGGTANVWSGCTNQPRPSSR